MKRLRRPFFARDALVVAPALLNKVLVAGPCSGRIVEVEAYRGADDPASHGYGGKTPRTAVMFGPAGHLYVYFSYGMHWCANAVTGEEGVCSAVLIRALAPISGLPLMRQRRGRDRRDQELCSGPAKLTQALGIDGSHNGLDLTVGQSPVVIADDGVAPPADPGVGARVGLSRGTDLPWRFVVSGDGNLSR